MFTQSFVRRLGIAASGVLLIACIFLAWRLTGGTPTADLPTGSAKPEEAAVNVDLVATGAPGLALAGPYRVVQLARSVEKGEGLAVVRFESNWSGRGEPDATGKASRGNPDTSLVSDE